MYKSCLNEERKTEQDYSVRCSVIITKQNYNEINKPITN